MATTAIIVIVTGTTSTTSTTTSTTSTDVCSPGLGLHQSLVQATSN